VLFETISSDHRVQRELHSFRKVENKAKSRRHRKTAKLSVYGSVCASADRNWRVERAFECVRRELFKQIFGGLECVGHSFGNVALLVFLRDV
jgi:hypothetical protein